CRLADEDEERGLERILGVMVVEEAAADAPHHRGVPPHQGGKGILVPASQEAGQEFPSVLSSPSGLRSARRCWRTTLNGLVGIVFNFPVVVASTSLSSRRAVLIHQFDDRR